MAWKLEFYIAILFLLVIINGMLNVIAATAPSDSIALCKASVFAEDSGMSTKKLGSHTVRWVEKFLNGSADLHPAELAAAVDSLNDFLLCVAEADEYDKLAGAPTELRVRLWKAQSPFDINETSSSYTSPLQITFEWNDERLLNLTNVIATTFGDGVIERFNSLPLRDEDLNRIWIPAFNFYSSYPLHSVSAINLSNAEYLRDARTLTSRHSDPLIAPPANGEYGIFAQVDFERVTDCHINSRYFPFDTALCFIYLRFPMVNGKSREPFVPRLASWYRPAQYYTSRVRQLKLEIIPSGLERDLMSTDEKWREQDTRAFCQKTSVFGAGYDVDCFVFFRFNRVSEKYVYPWLVTLNALTLGTIIGMYKGSDPSERFSLGALGLVPTSLGLYSLVDAIPIGYEGYPIVGYYWLALFINSLIAMLCCNIPLWLVHNHATNLLAETSCYYNVGHRTSVGVEQYLAAATALRKIKSVRSMSSLRSVAAAAAAEGGEVTCESFPRTVIFGSQDSREQETDVSNPNGNVQHTTQVPFAPTKKVVKIHKSLTQWFLLWSDITIMLLFVALQAVINLTAILFWTHGSSDDVTDFVKRSVKLPALISGAKKIVLGQLREQVILGNLTLN